MPDEPEPPRKFYKLKEAEFERVNPHPEAPGAATPDQDVHSHLRENLARADAAGLNVLTPQAPRSSRRKRDYWTLLPLGNGFFGAAVAYFGWRSMPGTFAISGMTAVTFGLLPAIRSTRVDPNTSLRGGRGAAGGRVVLGKVLVMVQVALSLTLLSAVV